MNLTPNQKRVILQVLNAFETGSVAGNYADVSIYHDGPNDRRQITYGAKQTTEYGNLAELITRYCEAPGAGFGAVLRPYIARIGHTPLVDDHNFIEFLEEAGADPIMHTVQDKFFEDAYFQPALRWAEVKGFTLALSMLVIFDSFIQSGGILMSIRNEFPEYPPAQGGGERRWISQYTTARNNWLAHHHRPAVRESVYRTHMLLAEIGRNNWDLHIRPINANGVKIP